MKNMIKNWRTTASGLSIIIIALVHLGFGIYHQSLDEQATASTILGVLSGIGLIVAGDSKSSLTKDEADQAYVQKTSCMLYKNPDCALKDGPPPGNDDGGTGTFAQKLLNPNKMHTPDQV